VINERTHHESAIPFQRWPSPEREGGLSPARRCRRDEDTASYWLGGKSELWLAATFLAGLVWLSPLTGTR